MVEGPTGDGAVWPAERPWAVGVNSRPIIPCQACRSYE